MTALYLDGFDHYGTGAASIGNMLEGSYAQASGNGCLTPAWGARTGTYALANPQFASANRLVLPSAKSKIFVSFGFSVDGLPLTNNANQVIAFADNANTVMAILWVTSTGTLTLTNGTNTTTYGSTSGPIIVSRNWHFIELDFDQAAGNFILRVDDASAANAPAMNISGLTIANPVQNLTFATQSSSSNAVPAWLDDLFIRDALGTTNNSWLGDRRIATLLPAGDTTTAGWSANRYTKLGAGILNITSTTASGGMVRTPTALNLNIGASDFTLETFVRFQSLPTSTNKSVIFSRWDQTANQRSYQLFLGSTALNNGSLCWQTSTDGTNATITQSIVYPWTPQLDTWYHIAMVRSAGQLLLFVNGQQFGLPIADATTYFAGTGVFSLGGEYTGVSTQVAGSHLQGWLDETRFTNGFARYTANFTPTAVNFPRGGTDPQWANVMLLAGYDTTIQDESASARVLSADSGAVQFTPNDGTSIGTFPVIGKATPDDNTFIEAPFVSATSILTLTANPANTNTVTVGTKDGTLAAVYTFKTVLAAAFDVLIDTTIQNTLQNLFNAINAGPGAGTKYGTSTTANFDVNATQLPAGQMQVTANRAGTSGNTIATTSSGITGSWTGATMSGGLNIPGPSNFKVQRLPPTTTLISAAQITSRTYKSDAGVGTFNTGFVGAHGAVTVGPTHALTVGPIYYNDIYELDPDTAGAISPTTITNGAIQVNRDT